MREEADSQSIPTNTKHIGNTIIRIDDRPCDIAIGQVIKDIDSQADEIDQVAKKFGSQWNMIYLEERNKYKGGVSNSDIKCAILVIIIKINHC